MGVLNNISNALGLGASASNATNMSRNTLKNKTTQLASQAGGVAPVNFRYPANMQQPSEEIMEWATTAGLRTPTTGMRNVAHGGKRRTHKKHRHHKRKSAHHSKRGGSAKKHTRRHRTMKRKTHRRRHH